MYNVMITYISIHCEGFPGVDSGKEPSCQCRRHKRREFDPWVRTTPGGGHGNPLQYSCLENPMDREAWWVTTHRVEKLDTMEAHTSTYTVKLLPILK